MNLKRLINNIGDLAIKEKLVNYSASAGSLAEINPVPVENYPLLFITPSGLHQVMENTIIYQITLTYVDRLLEDSSNDIDIYSNSIDELQNIVNGIKILPEVVKVEDVYEIRNFTDTEALNDRVSGSYCTIRITTLKETLCYIEGDE